MLARSALLVATCLLAPACDSGSTTPPPAPRAGPVLELLDPPGTTYAKSHSQAELAELFPERIPGLGSKRQLMNHVWGYADARARIGLEYVVYDGYITRLSIRRERAIEWVASRYPDKTAVWSGILGRWHGDTNGQRSYEDDTGRSVTVQGYGKHDNVSYAWDLNAQLDWAVARGDASQRAAAEAVLGAQAADAKQAAIFRDQQAKREAKANPAGGAFARAGFAAKSLAVPGPPIFGDVGRVEHSILASYNEHRSAIIVVGFSSASEASHYASEMQRWSGLYSEPENSHAYWKTVCGECSQVLGKIGHQAPDAGNQIRLYWAAGSTRVVVYFGDGAASPEETGALESAANEIYK